MPGKPVEEPGWKEDPHRRRRQCRGDDPAGHDEAGIRSLPARGFPR